MSEKSKTQAKSTEIPINLDDPQYYINREISLLQFQARVLEEAEDEHNPLLERLKFLAIVGSNLDEFFMVRVSGLKKHVESGTFSLSDDGLSPIEQLAVVRKLAIQVMVRAQECWRNKIKPALESAGIFILDYNELNEKQKILVAEYFDQVIYPVVTPLALDPGHPFPHISNLSLNLAVIIHDPSGKERFARLKVPNSILPRFVPLKRSSGSTRKDGTPPHNHYFVWLEQVISAHIQAFFPGMKVAETHPFRVTRDSDMEIQELEAEDLLETMEQSIRQRRFGSVVRLTINENMPQHIRELLIENLQLDPLDIYPVESVIGLSDLMSLYSLDRMDLKSVPFKPANPSALRDSSGDYNEMFNAIRKGDILLHHPYDSFTPVVDFLKLAAKDPDVLAIKQTLYRVGRRPAVVEALLDAVQNGKQVAVLFELKARFDEESNIGWARMLEKEGVHVIYGLLGLKTHSKIALVVRKEGEGIRRYIHLSTGNYNSVTANLYEDIGMFTCDEQIGADASDLFNYLTGYSQKNEYRKLVVAPVNLRSKIEGLIQREMDHIKNGHPGELIFKFNHLVDKGMIKKLYQASQAGVKISLLVRGTCCLKPGIKGVSENITVTSIVGRFLEHSRIYYFRNCGKEEIYLGSADLMPRNIDRRVEVLFPVQDHTIINRIHDEILSVYMKDNLKARIMQNDGNYQRRSPSTTQTAIDSQVWFINNSNNRYHGKNRTK